MPDKCVTKQKATVKLCMQLNVFYFVIEKALIADEDREGLFLAVYSSLGAHLGLEFLLSVTCLHPSI